MKKYTYEEPTEDGAEFMVGIAILTQFEKDGTLDKTIKTLRNTGFAADKVFEEKGKPVTGNVLFGIKNEAGKMFYYGGHFQIILNAKVIKFELTHTYNLQSFTKAQEKKEKELREQEKKRK